MCLFVSISTVEAVPGTLVGRTAWFGDDSPSALIFSWENQNLYNKMNKMQKRDDSYLLCCPLEARKMEDVEDLQIKRQETTHERQT